MARPDPHSYFDDAQPRTTHVELFARVSFIDKRLSGEALLTLDRKATGPLDLDTRGLSIESVADGAGKPLQYDIAAPDAVLGTRLRVHLGGSDLVRIRYRTSNEASALQWLEPAQTFGGKDPFLFSQCQAIHARSVLPLQDSPSVRIRYRATLEVPKRLRALMAASFVSREELGELSRETYEMPQPIPPYLFAFAVGDLVSRELGPRSRVWCEPKVADAAAKEFEDTDAMLKAGEELFGAYDWDRFDMLLMPRSFPYGGMENPRLTFLTPTLLAGDKSLVNVVAHELAHSWTGNLVTNASAEHFWLNEGWTMYAERRIQERLEGADMAALHAALGRRALDRAIAAFKDRPALTRLRPPLEGVDPDDAYSQVPYEKGYLFLVTIESIVGRPAFEKFLRSYLNEFRFGAVTVDDFRRVLERELPGAWAKAKGDAWVDGEGVPDNAPAAKSSRVEAIEKLGTSAPSLEQGRAWSPAEWQLYLESQKQPAKALCETLESRFALTTSTNYEVLVSWLVLATESGFDSVLPRVEEVLGQVGRMKYLKPLYQALAHRPETKARAREIFAKNAAGYHPIARQVLDGVLKR